MSDKLNLPESWSLPDSPTLAQVGGLLRAISHDMRNIVSGIKLSVEVIANPNFNHQNDPQIIAITEEKCKQLLDVFSQIVAYAESLEERDREEGEIPL